MTVTFSLIYQTHWGQELWVTWADTATGVPDLGLARPLHYTSAGRWQATYELPEELSSAPYYYLVRTSDGEWLRWESLRGHYLPPHPPTTPTHIITRDSWLDEPELAPLFSRAIDGVVRRRPVSPSLPVSEVGQRLRLCFVIRQPALPREARLVLSGAAKILGAWSLEQALPLNYLGEGRWGITLEIDPQEVTHGTWEYKYVLDHGTTPRSEWEEGLNRQLPTHLLRGQSSAIVSLDDGYLRLPVPEVRLAGVVAPLFALRSDADWGIGDFGTLRQLITWAGSAGMRAVQLLPINDTTFTRDAKDSYPYNAISVYALHPIYMDLTALGLANAPQYQQWMDRAKELRELPSLDYPRVLALKEEVLHTIYAQRGARDLATSEARAFLEQADHWLTPYAHYCVLRDEHHGEEPFQWGQEAHYSPERLQQALMRADYRERFDYYRWVQYLLSRQLSAVTRYAESLRVFIKGDLPIGVAPYGADLWQQPELFHNDQSAGAPPDAFAADGQNWGFPTYAWEVMRQDGYRWWRERFTQQSHYFHAFRIDHVLGFFRIWEVPRGQISGLLGHFHPALPYSLEQWQALLSPLLETPLHLLTRPLVHRQDLPASESTTLGYRLLHEGWIVPTIDPELFTLRYTEQRQYTSALSSDQPEDAELLDWLTTHCTETALIADPYQPGLYHPRIDWSHSRLYQHWSPELRSRWDEISHHYYWERHNQLYHDTGMERLGTLIQQTPLLLCAEDLGMIPPIVPSVLDALQVLSLELERMPKHPTSTGWATPASFPQRSIATTSTHDMPSLRGWWSALSASEQSRYLQEELGWQVATRSDYDEAELYTEILRQHLQSPALGVLIPLSDWMSIDRSLWLTSPASEQINHPEDSSHYWCYRFPITLEDLSKHPLLHRLKELITLTQRND